MNHGSLFSGIGGFDLAAEWIGWNNVLQCENDKFCQTILNYYWPKAILYENIKTTNFKFWRGKINVLTGGFPCQPYSQAGRRKGTEDDRHLWPEMLRAIREIQPCWIVGENVYGLINWNGGLVFEEVQADLEAEGYQVQPVILPACGKDAPHKRERIFFIAYAKPKRLEREDRKRMEGTIQFAKQVASDTQNQGLERTNSKRGTRTRRQYNKPNWERFPTQPPVCSRNDGLPFELDGITFPKWRNESIKAYGNAVVPQIVFEIFKVIDKMEEL